MLGAHSGLWVLLVVAMTIVVYFKALDPGQENTQNSLITLKPFGLIITQGKPGNSTFLNIFFFLRFTETTSSTSPHLSV